jgi:SAM-dependent methyltransferase
MDELTKQSMLDTLKRHGESFLHFMDSQWQIRLTDLTLTKEHFYRVLKSLRDMSATQIKELPPIEYLEVRPYTTNCLDDVLSLHLYHPDMIHHYCLNEHFTGLTEWKDAGELRKPDELRNPEEEEEVQEGGAGVVAHPRWRWMKRETHQRDVLPKIYPMTQVSLIQSWVEINEESFQTIYRPQMERWGTLEKTYRKVIQYRYMDKKDKTEYIIEARRATDVAYRTMREANVPTIPEDYVLRIILRTNAIPKKKTKLSYEDLGRILYRHSLFLSQVVQNEPFLIPETTAGAIMKDYGRLIRPSRFIPRDREDDSATFFLAPKPITLERTHLIEAGKVYCINSVLENYAITEKADGERMLLYIHTDGQAYRIDNTAKPHATGLRCLEKAYFNSLLDGEYVPKEELYGTGAAAPTRDLFAVFDVYFVGGECISSAPLLVNAGAGAGAPDREWVGKTRNDWMLRICQANRWDTSRATMEIRAKIHRVGSTPATFFKECAGLLKEAKQKKTWYPIDGLIFTPARLPVLGYYPGTKVEFSYNMRWDRVYKWKPAELNTIDFLVVQGNRLPNPLGDGRTYQEYLLHVGFNVDQMMDLDVYKALTLLYDPAARKRLHYGEGVYVPHLFRPFSYFEDGVHRAWVPVEDNGFAMAQNGDVLKHDMIVEFSYDRTDTRGVSYRWRPLRVRHDKTRIYRQVDANGNRMLSKTANDASTANSIWRTIHRPVSQDMIEGRVRVGEEEAPSCIEDRIQTEDDVYYAREIPRFHLLSRTMMNFHNIFVKGKLYAYPNVKNASLLELACGRAGDLKNWCANRYGFVVGIDNSKDNIFDPKEGSYARTIQTLLRKEQDVKSGKLNPKFAYVPPVVYAVGDCAKPIRDGTAALVKDDAMSVDVLQFLFHKKFPSRHPLSQWIPKLRGRGETGFDVVSCQFALHYFFESRDTLDGFFQNVVENLKTGGYFIATFMDGGRVNAKLKQKTKIEGIVKDTVLWAILKNYEEDAFTATRPFGNRIRVYLENINQLIPEYLIHFEFLVEYAGARGLRLVDSKTFDEILQAEKKKSQTKSNQRILDEFDAEHPVLKEFSEMNRWVIFQKQ